MPPKKLQANALSTATAQLLRAGVGKAHLVKSFFDNWWDPTLGERVAGAFRTKYLELREELPPNAIFSGLLTWAAGPQRASPERELAALSVIAYYFERCDIFEEPREAQS